MSVMLRGLLILASNLVMGCGAHSPGPSPSPTLYSVLIMNTEGLHNLPLGWTASLAAKATFSDGTAKDVTTSAQWASSDSSVLAVNAGTIVVEGFGSTKATAIYQGIIGSITVNVAPLNTSRGTEIWRLTTTVSSVTGPWPACLSIWQPVGTSLDSMRREGGPRVAVHSCAGTIRTGRSVTDCQRSLVVGQCRIG